MESGTTDVGGAQRFDALIDRRPAGRQQLAVIVVSVIISMIEGFDTQAISLAATDIADEFGVPVSEFGVVFSLGLVGTLVGAVVFGALSDRIGRKPVVIGALCVIAVGMLVTPATDSVPSLVFARLVTGLGIGAALPNVIALTSEYARPRRRAATVALMMCGYPLGAVVGGIVSVGLIPRFGWTSIFWIGGIAPVLMILAVVYAVPESVRFLVLRPDKRPLAKVLRRLDLPVEYADTLVPEPTGERASLAALFRGGKALGTLMLWVTMLLSLLMTYFLTSWIPVIAHSNGISARTAIVATVALNLGSILGSLVLGRYVRRRPAATVAAGYAIGAVAVTCIGVAGRTPAGLLTATFLAGFFAIGAQLCTTGICATFYDDALRATGVGATVGLARLGSILGPALGSLLISAGASNLTMFGVIGIVSAVAAAAMCVMSLFVLNPATGKRSGPPGAAPVPLVPVSLNPPGK